VTALVTAGAFAGACRFGVVAPAKVTAMRPAVIIELITATTIVFFISPPPLRGSEHRRTYETNATTVDLRRRPAGVFLTLSVDRSRD